MNKKSGRLRPFKQGNIILSGIPYFSFIDLSELIAKELTLAPSASSKFPKSTPELSFSNTICPLPDIRFAAAPYLVASATSNVLSSMELPR